MSEPITPEFLKRLAFLAPATNDEIRQLVAVAKIERYHAGAIVFREGDHLDRIFVVTDGHVAIEIVGPDRRPRRIHSVGPGELLGWSPILGPSVMTATGRALSDVRLVAINAGAILDVCEKDARFGYLLMRRTAAAIATRLNATRLQLLDVYGTEIPSIPPPEGAGL